MYACDIGEDFTAALSRTPLGKLTVGEALVNVQALVNLVASSKTLRVFEHHRLNAKQNRVLLDPFRGLKDALWSTGRQFNECGHPLGYIYDPTVTSLESVNLFTDHCYAIAFEIPVTATVEAAHRIGCRDDLHILDVYFSAIEGQKLTVIRSQVQPSTSAPDLNFRIFACYSVKSLFGVQTFNDFPSGAGWVQESPVKRLLGCEDSLTQGYFIQDISRNFTGKGYTRRE
ncbi:hypothetical protein BD410DRAFT_804880 [Rickenella mellea]|uniref:Uncharacterized protein n=1 Tax=Rickenella mellea TaxID=50990 RepID=A0A4Y7Q035_9AGAM|nr:hypothetical protein BD410DRAFT_804880 [Rickenella mellea]